MYCVRNRWYTPRTGRWLTPDPIGYAGGRNLYEYCGSRPWEFVDPMGLDWGFSELGGWISGLNARLEIAEMSRQQQLWGRQMTDVLQTQGVTDEWRVRQVRNINENSNASLSATNAYATQSATTLVQINAIVIATPFAIAAVPVVASVGPSIGMGPVGTAVASGGVSGAVGEAAHQAAEIGLGARDEVDPSRIKTAVFAGAAVGAGSHYLGKLVEKCLPSITRWFRGTAAAADETGATPAPVSKTSAPPEPRGGGTGPCCGPGPAGTTGSSVTTGQTHHPISRIVQAELERHPIRAGKYQPRDPRFTTQAVDEASHRGYQMWHRELDAEIAQ